MIVTRVGPLSFAKIIAVLYVVLGVFIGACFSLISIVGGAMAPDDSPAAFGMLFGAAAIIVFPIFYGVLGFIGALIGAALYNLGASMVGGVEVDVQ